MVTFREHFSVSNVKITTQMFLYKSEMHRDYEEPFCRTLKFVRPSKNRGGRHFFSNVIGSS